MPSLCPSKDPRNGFAKTLKFQCIHGSCVFPLSSHVFGLSFLGLLNVKNYNKKPLTSYNTCTSLARLELMAKVTSQEDLFLHIPNNLPVS